MRIDELSTRKGMKYVTVTMSYDEMRDISNGLYYMTQSDKKYKGIYAKCKTLFDMIKHGMIQPETVRTLHELENEKKEGV